MAFAWDKQTVKQSWRAGGVIHTQKATCWLTWHGTVAAVSLSTPGKTIQRTLLFPFFLPTVVQFSSLWTHLLFGHRRCWNWLSLLPANGGKAHSIKQTRPGKNEKLPLKSHTHTHSHKCLTKINEWDEGIASNWSAACNLPDRLLPSATLYSNQVKRKNVDFTLTRTWRTLTLAFSHTYTHTHSHKWCVGDKCRGDCDCDLKLDSACRENEKLFAHCAYY